MSTLNPPEPPKPPERLSPQMMVIIQLLGDGLTDAQIARRVGISATTARSHVRRIRHYFGVQTRTAVIAEAYRRGILVAGLDPKRCEHCRHPYPARTNVVTHPRVITDRLRDIRFDRKLTQDQFGKLMRVSARTIGRWELGHRDMHLDEAIQIANAAGYVLALYPKEDL